ncbi:MAG: hypothetical protein ACREFW_08725, partial [Rhizomicrobium sp.]
GYNWRSNKGYGTPEHCEGLKAHGITPHHRRSFAPVRAILAGWQIAPPEVMTAATVIAAA